MSTVTLEEPQLHQWTREDYQMMADSGIIPPDARVELIDGKIIEMSPQNRSHAITISLTGDTLRRLFGEGYATETQVPMFCRSRMYVQEILCRGDSPSRPIVRHR